MTDDSTTPDQVDQTTGTRDWRRFLTFKRLLATALLVVVGLWVVSTIGAYAAELDFEGLDHPYALLFGFVALDAVIPIFPSESLLNTGSTLVAQGSSNLEIWRLILAASAIMMVAPSWSSNWWGLALLAPVAVQQFLARSKQTPVSAA